MAHPLRPRTNRVRNATLLLRWGHDPRGSRPSIGNPRSDLEGHGGATAQREGLALVDGETGRVADVDDQRLGHVQPHVVVHLADAVGRRAPLCITKKSH